MRLTLTLALCRSGLQQRRNSFEDGVAGTTCPIPPGANFTYIMQAKDQIGTYYYFPSLAFHKAAGGFGGIRVLSRPQIPVPFPPPAADYTALIGDWYRANHTVRRRRPLFFSFQKLPRFIFHSLPSTKVLTSDSRESICSSWTGMTGPEVRS